MRVCLKYLPLLFILSGVSLPATSFAKKNKSDSLMHLLKTGSDDTTRVKVLYDLAWELKDSKPDTSIVLANEGLKRAREGMGFKNPEQIFYYMAAGRCWHELGAFYQNKGNYGVSLDYYSKAIEAWDALEKNVPRKYKTEVVSRKAKSLGNIGVVYEGKGNYPKALNCFFKALKMREESGDKKGLAINMGNIGNVYEQQGDYTIAFDYYFKALKLNEELGNKTSIAFNLGNIGSVCEMQGEYPKALDYYKRALKMNDELGSKNNSSFNIENIGNVYEDQGKFAEAIGYYFKALEMSEALGNKTSIASNLGDIGKVYGLEGDSAKLAGNYSLQASNYSKALEYNFKALKIGEEMGAKNDISTHLEYIGSLYTKQKKYREAEVYLKRALILADSIDARALQKADFESLSILYAEMGDYSKAYLNYKRYTEVKDKLFNEEKQNYLTRREMNYQFDKKESALKAQEERDRTIAVAEDKRKTIIIDFVILGLLLVIVFSGFLFNRFRIIRKQKFIIEEKQKEIVDSIHYAKRIQDALLKDQDQVTLHLPEHFILFKPKDIVSGDFYWSLEKQHNYWYVAAVDCTGHGVPGAFLTLLGTSFLNELNATPEMLSPAEILNRLRARVIKELGQTGKSGEGRDGMDMSILRIQNNASLAGLGPKDLVQLMPQSGLQSKDRIVEVQWAGANNALYLIRKNELTEIRPDKQPIGYAEHLVPFTNHSVNLTKGDTVYIFSDGYADQFGGSKGKKFMKKRLKETFLNISGLGMNEQKAALNETFESWKGQLQQMDDVCVIGVRI